MPDYHLFYQAIDPFFDPDDIEQNSNLKKAMQIISGKLDKGQVVAVGFSGFQLFDRLALNRTLSSIASNLDGGLGWPSLFATGVFGWAECTAICVNKKFVVEKRGRVMRVNPKEDDPFLTGEPYWKCIPESEIPTDDLKRDMAALRHAAMFDTTVPEYFELNSRGLAYVCGKFGGQKMVIGFTHSISAEGRENTYDLLTRTMQAIWNEHPDYRGCSTIFGGDFKFTPGPIDKPYYASYACKPAGRSAPASSEEDKPKDDKAAPGGREPIATSNNRGFDFWVANKEITNDDASVYEETHGYKLSDHCGVALRLSMEVSFEEVKK